MRQSVIATCLFLSVLGKNPIFVAVVYVNVNVVIDI